MQILISTYRYIQIYTYRLVTKQCFFVRFSRFRVPLNIFTCTALMGMHSFNSIRANQVLFFICGVSSLIGFFLSRRFSELKQYKKTILSSPVAVETMRSGSGGQSGGSKGDDVESALVHSAEDST